MGSIKLGDKGTVVVGVVEGLVGGGGVILQTVWTELTAARRDPNVCWWSSNDDSRHVCVWL